MVFDPTNKFLDAAYQNPQEWAQKANDDQVLANCTALQTLIGLNHSIINGEHSATLNLSGFGGYSQSSSAQTQSSPAVGSWFTFASPIPGTAGLYFPSIFLAGLKYGSPGGLIEILPIWKIQSATFTSSGAPLIYQLATNQVVRLVGLRSLDGVTWSANVKYPYITPCVPYGNGTQVHTLANVPYVGMNTYAGGIVGKGYLKSHYNQKQGVTVGGGLNGIYQAFASDHNTGTGASYLNATPPYGDGQINTDMVPADNYTNGVTVIKPLMAHGGAFPVWTFNVVPKSGVIAGSGVELAIRPGFDDTQVYACITGISGGPMVTEQYTLQSTYYNTTAPTNYPALVVTNPAVVYQSYGVDIDQTELTALQQLLAVYNLEHNVINGGHKVPIPRLTGATPISSGTIVASGTVGNQTRTIIDASSGSAYFYYFPAMTGQIAGCGIVDAGIACDGTNVYLNVTRRTAPAVNDAAHNTFNYQVLRINDS